MRKIINFPTNFFNGVKPSNVLIDYPFKNISMFNIKIEYLVDCDYFNTLIDSIHDQVKQSIFDIKKEKKSIF